MRSSHSTSEALSASRPPVAGDELVRPTEEDLRWQVPARFAAEGALNSDGLKGELPDAGWNVAAAPLACDDEGFAA